MVELAKISGVISAPPEAVWAILADFSRPQRLSSLIDKCDSSGDTVGSIRVVHARGRRIHEKLIEANEPEHIFRYEILQTGEMPADGLLSYIATVRLRPVTGGSTEIEWSSIGDVEGELTPFSILFGEIYSRAIRNIQDVLANN